MTFRLVRGRRSAALVLASAGMASGLLAAAAAPAFAGTAGTHVRPAMAKSAPLADASVRVPVHFAPSPDFNPQPDPPGHA